MNVDKALHGVGAIGREDDAAAGPRYPSRCCTACVCCSAGDRQWS
jgi:hypothetical protein